VNLLTKLSCTLLLIGVVGCRQEQPPKTIVPQPPKTIVPPPEAIEPKHFLDPDYASYTPADGYRNAYEYIKSRQCTHRHYDAGNSWEPVEEKPVWAGAWDAYNCNDVAGTIIVHEKSGASK
jgi:hypothetical protein